MGDTQAIKPDFNIPTYIESKKELDVETLTEDERILGTGGDQKFWLTLRKHIENELIEIDKIGEAAIANGASLEEIGRNTIVISYVKGIVNKIFNVVEDAREAVENGRAK